MSRSVADRACHCVMNACIANRVVAITGASSGIGRATAVTLRPDGARSCCRRGARIGWTTSCAVDRARGRPRAGRAGRRDERSGRRGRLVARRVASVRPARRDDLQRRHRLSRRARRDAAGGDAAARGREPAWARCTPPAAALPVFAPAARRHIIAISSIAGRRGVGGMSVYSATKAAQIGFIEGLRAEFVGHRRSTRRSSTRSRRRTPSSTRPFAATSATPSAAKGPRQSAEAVARLIVDASSRRKPRSIRSQSRNGSPCSAWSRQRGRIGS